MAEQSKGSPEPKTEAEKKQAETVQLTAEELRAIAGGSGVSTGGLTGPGTGLKSGTATTKPL